MMKPPANLRSELTSTLSQPSEPDDGDSEQSEAASDHTIFRGEWANGKKHGVGHLISPGFLFGHYVTRQVYINGHLQHEASSEL